MHCPLHEDANRSSSLNFEKDLWYCQVCDIGMSAEELVSKMRSDPSAVVPPPAPGQASRGGGYGGRKRADGPSAQLPDNGTVAGWHSAFMSNRKLLKKFQRKRGLSVETLRRFEIGYDERSKAITIPVRDVDGVLINVRRYQMDPTDGRRKIWSVRGHGEHALYPVEIFDEEPEEVLVCEGEWDALLAIQNGFAAITRTGTADAWKSSWNSKFKDKDVWICHDMDEKGQTANGKLARELRGFARETTIVKLPYEVAIKHGKDLTDFFHLDKNDAEDFMLLLDEAMPKPDDLDAASVLDSFDSQMAGKQLNMRVTITGKRFPTFLIPKEAQLSCNMKAGKKCDYCPMQEEHEGEWAVSIDPKDPIVLKMVGFTDSQLLDAYRERFSIQKCTLLRLDRKEEMTVEEIYVRPAIDQHRHDPTSSDFTNRKIFSVGKHDSQPNTTVRVKGAIYPNPRTQHNEFLAHAVTNTDTMIDTYTLTETGVEMMKIFQTEDPLKKIRHIADDLTMHVTKIYGRPELHELMDLVWHSMTSFTFMGDIVPKGWLDVLIIGDTRTGKSEVAAKLIDHYQAGEMVSCEAASFAGIVGGLQQLGTKEWEISWGVLPLNDRRIVVLDEVSGLTHEQIGQMSSIRSSGIADLLKIRQARTLARTRLIWLGNLRDGGRMAQYAHGVYAVRPLIGNMEDVARFDLAMAVSADEVESTDINKERHDTRRHSYPSEACSQLVQWVWSRKPDQVEWEDGAESDVLEYAIETGDRYIEDPPLVQTANVRFKIARVAVALAARTFSTTADYQSVYVTRKHVEAAMEFIDRLYGMEAFGYLGHSKERIDDAKDAIERWGQAKDWLKDEPEIVRFLRTSETGTFKSNDMQDFMNLERKDANAIVRDLFNLRLVTRKGAYIEITAMLQQMLREIQNGE